MCSPGDRTNLFIHDISSRPPSSRSSVGFITTPDVSVPESRAKTLKRNRSVVNESVCMETSNENEVHGMLVLFVKFLGGSYCKDLAREGGSICFLSFYILLYGGLCWKFMYWLLFVGFNGRRSDGERLLMYTADYFYILVVGGELRSTGNKITIFQLFLLFKSTYCCTLKVTGPA